MKEKKQCQVNIFIKESWKLKLERAAREKSYKEDRNISLIDLIRETLNDVYHLDDEEVINNE